MKKHSTRSTAQMTALNYSCIYGGNSSRQAVPSTMSNRPYYRGHAKRTLLIFALLLTLCGNVWADTKVVDKYIQYNQYYATFSIEDVTNQLGTTLTQLSNAYYIKWYVVDGSSNSQNLSNGGYQQESWSVAVKDNPWPYRNKTTYLDLDNTVEFRNGDNLSTKADEWGLFKPRFYAPSGKTFADLTDYNVICEASAETSPSTPGVKYIWHFNATGTEPDDFVGTFSGTPSEQSCNLARSATSATIDFSNVLTSLPSVQYARFYLVNSDGESQDISSTAISVTGGQTTDKASRGVYVYTGSPLTADNLSVTVSLDQGTFEDYQLMAVFSDDAPATSSGITVTQEPSVLDEECIYSFVYESLVIDKYIKWNVSESSDFDISSLPDDLGKTLSEIATSYQIAWYIYDESNSKIKFYTSDYTSGKWVITSPNDHTVSNYSGGWTDNGDGIESISLNANNLSDIWSSVNKIRVIVPNKSTETFADYRDYTVVCEVRTPGSSANATVKYVFHFNETGKDPNAFEGNLKTLGKEASKSDVVETAATSATLDMSEALGQVSGAKYVRFYLEQNGTIVDPIDKLTVSGGTACPEDAQGFYIYKEDGLEASDLEGVSLTLPVGQFEDYQVISVFSTDAPTFDGTTIRKEPDWNLKYTYTFEYPFKGDVTDATKIEKSFVQLDTDWDKYNHEVYVKFDFDNKKIHLYQPDDTGTPLASVDFLDEQDNEFWSAYSSYTLGTSDNFYIRWFLKDKATGIETYIPNSIRNWNGESLYEDCAKERNARFWSTKMSNEKNLNNIMHIKVDGTPDSPGTTFNLTDYDLVCTISTSGNDVLDASNQVTMEATPMQMQYTFHFDNKEFQAENINDPSLKVVYKDALYDKTTGQITPDLFTNYAEVLTELSTSIDNFQTNGYLRWYVAEKESGDLVADMADWGYTAGQTYTKNDTYGYYLLPTGFYDYNKTTFNPTITLPSTYDWATDYKNYQVVCVLTIDQTGMDLPSCEPATMQVKYVFNLILTEEEYANLPFVHYKGQSGRDWVKPEGSNGNLAQQVWTDGAAADYTGDIRQGVHTYEYTVYVCENDVRKLLLPLENYESSGNNLEPRAYYRWYDYMTDKAVVNNGFEFTKFGSALKEETGGRGLFALNIGESPTHNNVGVTFKALSDFSTDGIHIACDVSKYSDGITTLGSNNYLVHEPTLSTRYIYHIYPASVIADKLETSRQALAAAETTGTMAALETAMASMFEDNGKVIVSLGSGKSGSFALRLEQNTTDSYPFLSGGSYSVPTGVTWYAYVEDNGTVYKKKLETNTPTKRIETFQYGHFEGTIQEANKFVSLADGTEKQGTISAQEYHVVGFVTNGSNMAPVAHYDLHFIEAPPIAVSDLKSVSQLMEVTDAQNAILQRTDEWMGLNYTLAGILDFDGNPETDSRVTGREEQYYSTTNWDDAPTSSANNMTWVPREWDDIQYGFSYPQLTATLKNGYGGTLWLSPEHGDYIMLKSMNAPGISTDMNTPPHYYHWWSSSELYDYTHTYTDDAKYGTFLYTDASHESRSLATIPFDATLCSGATFYFTMAVADMTSGHIKPQLLVRISSVDEHGNLKGIVSFHTCDITTTGASTGSWYQVYGQGTLPTNFDDSSTSYVAEVINYANDTNGADFAIDQIAIYLNTAKVEVDQSGALCNDNDKVRIFASADKLIQNAFVNQEGMQEMNVYYRIFERNADNAHIIREREAVTGVGVYDDDTSKPSGYGVVTLTNTYDASTLTTDYPETSGFYKDAEGNVMFQLAYRKFDLDPSKTYFVSIYTLGAAKPGDTVGESDEAAGWGNPYNGNQCTVYSGDFSPKKIYIEKDLDGEDTNSMIGIECGATTATKELDLVLKYPLASGAYVEYDDIHFDFFLGTKADLDAATRNNKYLKDAVAELRKTNTSAISSISEIPSDLDADYKVLIETYMNNGKLLLSASTKFNREFKATEGELNFLALPVEKDVNEGTTQFCSPIELNFTVSTSGAPELVIGFDDVDYSKALDTRTVRIGLEQLRKLKTGGYKLHIPVHRFAGKGGGTDSKLNFSDGYLYVCETNDPTVTLSATLSENQKLAKIIPASGEKAFVGTDQMYLVLDFAAAGCDFNSFHEGFYYDVNTLFYDEVEAETAASRCTGELYLQFKIVPEFVTWEGQKIGETDFYNANWNNDGNWLRSERSELYKGAAFGSQNTATYGHPNGYQNNAELNSALISHPGFVPMKFTYVTMPTDNHAPDLNDMTYETTGSVQTGGHLIMLQNTLITNTSPVGNHNYNSPSTSGIRYDLLVRYGEHSEGGEGCFGHRSISGGSWIDDERSTADLDAITNVFDCEKFDGNICREIYFKPGAELLQQQRLTYQKAWVEKELTANKWYLMSTPLKGTYAGDMYVPFSMTNVATSGTVAGQQVTEAFQPINFSTTAVVGTTTTSPQPAYSRTKYPIYQRSWNTEGSKVYTRTNDARATYYSANLKYNGVTSVETEWSHTYNDVQVPYTSLTGFSIRAHKKDRDDNALIRLPKEDTKYDYYQWNNQKAPSGAVSQTVDKTNAIGQFVFDKASDDQDKVEVTLGDVQSQGIDADGSTYYLLGNPFVGSLDMGKFFASNPAFGSTYYTYEAGVLTTIDATAVPATESKHIIKPLQGFFVKTANAPETVVFHREMLTDGNWELGTQYTGNGARATQPVMALRLSTTASTAVVELSDDASDDYVVAEDVTSLFDSNLADVPMVYTVAGQQAVSIDQRPQLDVVPFGVVCSSDEAVSVSVSGLSDHRPIYVFDAVTGESSEVFNGQTISIQPNDYGRYFISTTDGMGKREATPSSSIVVSVRQRQVTVSASEPVSAVSVVTLGGAQVFVDKPADSSCTFSLPRGTYVIEATSVSGEQRRMKVVVQ